MMSNSFHINKIQYFKNFNILKKYLDINQKRFNLRYLFSSLLKDTHSSSTLNQNVIYPSFLYIQSILGHAFNPIGHQPAMHVPLP